MRLSDKNANIKGGKVQTTGTAPAKITSATLRSSNGLIKFVLGLPLTDPTFSSYSMYYLESIVTTQPAFPGGSPFLRDRTNKPEDDSCPVGTRRHYWVVTHDVNNVPNVPVSANAFYVGSIINTTTQTIKVS